MQFIFSFIIAIAIGMITSHFAQQRGRDRTAWFFIGMFLGIIGLILLFVLPSINEEEQQSVIQIEPEAISTILPYDYENKPWYFLTVDREQIGPVGFEALRQKWNQREISLDTLVWCEGMSDWRKINDLKLFKKTPPAAV